MLDEVISAATAALRESCAGEVLTPADPGYAQACAAWNLAWTQRPAIVVSATREADVVQAVQHAVTAGLGVAVQTTGHGVTVPADSECLLIAMGGLDQVEVDPARLTATVGGGATWDPVLAAAQQHGLAPLLGSSPHVGVVAYSLGGGIGWLTRKHGLAVDQVRSLRVVLADGSLVTASPTQEPELFWALCGTGGGSLGVVVQITVGLVPVTEVYAGSLCYPVEQAREVFERYRTWAMHSPAELTSAFNITAFPPVDLVPEPLRGKAFAIVRGCYSGTDVTAGQELVQPWRQWRAPAIDMWAPMPFARVADASQDPVDPLPAGPSGRWLASLPDELPEIMVQAVLGEPHPSPALFVEARHTSGVMRTPNESVCFAARSGEWAVEIVGLLTGPGAEEELDRRSQAAWHRLAPNLAPLPSYLNFLEGQERVSLARAAFPTESHSRLAAASRRYDPANVFRYAAPIATW